MGMIYAHSSCTIAAVQSVGIDGTDHGFLLQELDPLQVTISMPYDRIPLEELSKKSLQTR